MLFRFLYAILVTCVPFSYAEYTDNDASIVIIGAGVAGIAAATRLRENNFTNVRILEAENRMGGRIQSVPFGTAVVDLGAQYCHGEKGNIVYTLVKEFDMLESHQPDFELYYSQSGEEMSVDIQDAVFQIAHCIQHRKDFNATDSEYCANELSEGVCLKTSFDKVMNCSLERFRPMLELTYTWLRNYKSATESAIDLDDVNLVSDYEECEGDQMLDWPGVGYKTILDIMINKDPVKKDKLKDLNILFNATVSKIINWNSGKDIHIELKDGQSVAANHVIFTPSVGVLKANHDSLFSPPLPKDKTFAIENIGYGDIVKIALFFEKQWWMLHGPRMWGCVFSAPHLQELRVRNLTWVKHFVAFTAAPNNPNTLIAFFAGEECPSIENLSDNDLLIGIRYILRKCFVRFPGIDMPTKMVRSMWWTNPNFRGSFSYDSVRGYTPDEQSVRDRLASPIWSEHGTPTLLFAGEATHRTMFATVHGAIETGYREADRLIDFYNMSRT